MYAFNDRPKGRTKEQVDIAVDSLARLSLGNFIVSLCTSSRHIYTIIWASGHFTGFEDAQSELRGPVFFAMFGCLTFWKETNQNLIDCFFRARYILEGFRWKWIMLAYKISTMPITRISKIVRTRLATNSKLEICLNTRYYYRTQRWWSNSWGSKAVTDYNPYQHIWGGYRPNTRDRVDNIDRWEQKLSKICQSVSKIVMVKHRQCIQFLVKILFANMCLMSDYHHARKLASTIQVFLNVSKLRAFWTNKPGRTDSDWQAYLWCFLNHPVESWRDSRSS